MEARINFANKMLNKDHTFCSKIKFSDECKISLSPHAIQFIRKRDEEDWHDPRFRNQKKLRRRKINNDMRTH
jgi:hypothetical protein